MEITRRDKGKRKIEELEQQKIGKKFKELNEAKVRKKKALKKVKMKQEDNKHTRMSITVVTSTLLDINKS